MLPSDLRAERDRLVAECDARGLAETKALVLRGVFNPRKRAIVQQWIDEQEAAAARAADGSEREIDREIARGGVEAANEANRIARRANLISISAAVLAGLALAVAIYAALREFPISH